MYQRKRQIANTRRQWRYLSSRLRRWTADGRFATFSRCKQEALRKKLQLLLRRMLRWERAGTLRKALGGAVLLLGLSAPSVQAQVNFAPPETNPFGLTVSPQAALRFEVLADVDGDGDLDIVSVAYGEGDYEDDQVLEWRKNLSTDGGITADFGLPSQDFFGLILEDGDDASYLRPEFADIDGDGDLDMFLGEYNYYDSGRVLFYINEGTAEDPVFGKVQFNPFGMDLAGTSATTPNLADLDGDGDLDLLSLFYLDEEDTYDVGIVYQENIGTATEPLFGTAVRETFGLPSTFAFPTFMELGDIDNDGDVDILAGNTNYDDEDYSVDYQFYENTGDAVNPAFAAGVLNPFNLLPTTGLFLWPMLGDLDNDGDLDVLNGQEYDEQTYETNWTYQENLLQDVAVEALADELTQVKVFPTISEGTFNLQLRTEVAPLAVTLSVYNNQGRLLQQCSYPSTMQLDETIRLHYQPAGTYHLKLQNGEKQWTGTVIKQ